MSANQRNINNPQPSTSNAQEYKLRLGALEDIAYTVARFPNKVDFSKWEAPVHMRKKRLEDDQVDLAEAGIENQVHTGNPNRPKSEKQLQREQKREAWQKHLREKKREYIFEDESVNDEWVHFRARVSNRKQLSSSESVEKAMEKQEQAFNDKMRSTTTEISAYARTVASLEKSAPRRPGRRRKVKGEDGDDDEEMEEEREDFDFDEGVDDDEEYFDAALENPQLDIRPPEDIFDDSDEDEELSASGKDLKRVLDGIRGKKKDDEEEEEKKEVKAEPEEKTEVKSEEETSDGEPKKRKRGRPKKSEKEKEAKRAAAKAAASATATPSTSATPAAATPAPTSGQKRKLKDSPSSASKKIKTESVEDITDPAMLEREIVQLFQQRKSILVKDLMALYLKNVKRTDEEKEKRMKLLSGILRTNGVKMEKGADGSNYFVYKG